MWGFMTCMNDILIPHLKSVFALSYAEGAIVQFSFFSAYFMMSLPAGTLVARIGYKRASCSDSRRPASARSFSIRPPACPRIPFS